MLCGLNFFFEILPLISEISGRVTRSHFLNNGSLTNSGAFPHILTVSWKEGRVSHADDRGSSLRIDLTEPVSKALEDWVRHVGFPGPCAKVNGTRVLPPQKGGKAELCLQAEQCGSQTAVQQST